MKITHEMLLRPSVVLLLLFASGCRQEPRYVVDTRTYELTCFVELGWSTNVIPCKEIAVRASTGEVVYVLEKSTDLIDHQGRRAVVLGLAETWWSDIKEELRKLGLGGILEMSVAEVLLRAVIIIFAFFALLILVGWLLSIDGRLRPK